jgi:endonuclease YncB( thermonuclease family)
MSNADDSELLKYNDNNTSFFFPTFTRCKCVSVYDGDTIHIAAFTFNKPFKWKLRLRGIDTPELRTKNIQEKELGYEAKKALSDKILGKILWIEDIKYDKYGRLLGTIYLDDENICDWMVAEGHAIKYDGGTKNKWCV